MWECIQPMRAPIMYPRWQLLNKSRRYSRLQSKNSCPPLPSLLHVFSRSRAQPQTAVPARSLRNICVRNPPNTSRRYSRLPFTLPALLPCLLHIYNSRCSAVLQSTSPLVRNTSVTNPQAQNKTKIGPKNGAQRPMPHYYIPCIHSLRQCQLVGAG